MVIDSTFHTSSSGSPYVSIFVSNPIFFSTGEPSRKVGESNSRLVNVPTGESKVGHTPETAPNKKKLTQNHILLVQLWLTFMLSNHIRVKLCPGQLLFFTCKCGTMFFVNRRERRSINRVGPKHGLVSTEQQASAQKNDRCKVFDAPEEPSQREMGTFKNL